MLGNPEVPSGVNTVLGRAKKWLDKRQIEPNRTEGVKLRITSNDKGIAQIIKHLSNPLHYNHDFES
jgi:hypothetical protein